MTSPNPLNPAELIAVARISGGDPRPGRHRITVGGDGLAALRLPAPVHLHRPAYTGNDLKRILASVRPHPREDGEFRAAVLASARVTEKQRGYVGLKTADGAHLDDDCSGWWICAERSRLAEANAADEYFVFQLLGLPVISAESGVEVGVAADYLETGAHGVLEIHTSEKEPVLVPIVPLYIDLDFAAGRIVVRNFEDFL